MPLLSRLAARVSSSEFRDEKLASLDRKSHRSNPFSVTQPGTRRSSLRHVSEPPSLNPFATLCPYYYPAATCCCLESKSLFTRPRISNSRTAGRQPVTAGIIDQNSAHHLTACCPQLPWQVRQLDHSNSWRGSTCFLALFSLPRLSCLSSFLLCLFLQLGSFTFAWPCFFDRGNQL